MGRWFFVRARGCVDEDGVDAVRSDLLYVGKVPVARLGTEADPKAGWFIVRSEAETITDLREQMGNLSDRIDLVEVLSRKEQGFALAKQRPLFG